MTEYILSVFGACALLGALSLIHYKKEGAERTAQRILFAAALILPLFDTATSLGGEVPAMPPYSEDIDGEYIEVACDAFCEGILRAVCERFSLSEGTVEVEAAGFNFRLMRAEKIKVTLSGAAVITDRRAIEKFVEGEGLGECEVRLSVG